MNHLKIFESWLEDMNNKQDNHILGDFSYRLEKILISVSELTQQKNTKIRRSFNIDDISIIYYVHNNVKILKINLDIKDDKFYIKIKSYKQSYVTNIKQLKKGCDELLDFINNKLEKYSIINKENPANNIIKMCVFGMPLSEKDNIIETLEDFYIFLDSLKYNL